MNHCFYPSVLGQILILSNGKEITGLYLPEHNIPIPDAPVTEDAALKTAKSWLTAYFLGQQPDPTTLPLSPSGTPFQKKVWKLLLQIPYGQTITYGSLAGMLGNSMSAQAVGQAVGKNPISIIIPCHRVVGKNNHLTGYAGGIPNKVMLLTHEGCSSENMIYPKETRG